jgi:agmatine/peptidylarginine deiminase
VLLPEFAPQSGVILTWPHRFSDWQSRLAVIEPVYVEIARAISAQESLLVLARDSGHRAHIRQRLASAGIDTTRIHCACIPTNDTWIRDYGPLTVERGGHLQLLDYTFNAWGGKYAANLDDAVTAGLARAGWFGDLPCRRQSLVLEGGSIDVDGDGTLLTTSRCLLAPTRNPGLGRAGLEAHFRQTLGVERVLWIEHGELAGDDTDAHVDMLARFCDAGTIAYSQCTDAGDRHFAPLSAMERQLRGFRTRAGVPYRLVPLPIPAPVYDAEGQRLPASYANFLIVNGAVLLPVYDDPADAVAQRALAGCFPARTIVAVRCRPLIEQYGSLHCATMQLPAGVLTAPTAERP